MKSSATRLKENKKVSIGLIVQTTLSICSLIFLIISFFEHNFYYIMEFVLALTLFTMSYNNSLVYKRKYMTVIYILFGIFLITSGIIGVIK